MLMEKALVGRTGGTGLLQKATLPIAKLSMPQLGTGYFGPMLEKDPLWNES